MPRVSVFEVRFRKGVFREIQICDVRNKWKFHKTDANHDVIKSACVKVFRKLQSV